MFCKNEVHINWYGKSQDTGIFKQVILNHVILNRNPHFEGNIVN